MGEMRQSVSWGWVLLAAVWFFCLGLVGGLAAGLSASISGALCWWLFIERRGVLTYRQGALVGFLIQGFAYPVLFFISGIFGLPSGIDPSPTFQISGLMPSVRDIRILVRNLWSFLLWSVLGTMITVPIGVTGGLILIGLRRRVQPDSESN